MKNIKPVTVLFALLLLALVFVGLRTQAYVTNDSGSLTIPAVGFVPAPSSLYSAGGYTGGWFTNSTGLMHIDTDGNGYFTEVHLIGRTQSDLVTVATGGKIEPIAVTAPLSTASGTLTINGLRYATNTAPGNTSTILAWVAFTNTAGGVFRLPLYQ